MIGEIAERDMDNESDAAVDAALQTHRRLVSRYGEDPGYQGNFEHFLLGYRGFAEAVAGDGLRKVHYLFKHAYPEAELRAGLQRGDLLLQEVTADGGTQRCVRISSRSEASPFEIRWKSGRADVTDVELVDLRRGGFCFPVARASLVDDGPSPADRVSHGTLWADGFHSFMEAMELVGPSLSHDLARIPRGRPFSETMPYSMEEIGKAAYRKAIAYDGGLPGMACAHVFDTMLAGRGAAMLRKLGSDAAELIGRHVEDGCVWGAATLSGMDGDVLSSAVETGDVPWSSLPETMPDDGRAS